VRRGQVGALANKVATVKRAVVTGAKRGAPTVHLEGLPCTQLVPVSSDTMLRLGLSTPHAVWSLFIVGRHDIRSGDWLALDGLEYTIQGVQTWEFPKGQGTYMQVTVEEARS